MIHGEWITACSSEQYQGFQPNPYTALAVLVMVMLQKGDKGNESIEFHSDWQLMYVVVPGGLSVYKQRLKKLEKDAVS